MKPAIRLFALLVLAASLARGADAPPPDSPPPETKHKLGGGFKGRPVVAAKAGGAPAKAPPPAREGGAKDKPPRIVIDNSRVKKSQPPGAREESPPREVAPPPPPAVVMPKIVDAQGHDETYWRAKAASVRDAVAKARDSAAAAEAEEKREENDFYAWDDGQYRDNVIKPAWDRAKDEAVKARQELEDAQKHLESLEDEARRAGAYPGWIREGPGR